MEGRHGINTPIFEPLPMNFGDSRFPQKVEERHSAQKDERLWFDKIDLPVEVGQTACRLVIGGVSVTRRAALYNIGDIDRFTAILHCGDHLVQQLPGRADERSTRLVLVETRPLPDKHQISMVIDLAENCLGPGPV